MPINTFFVSELNATSASTAAATFGETIEAQPTVSFSGINTIAGTSAATASTFFSFYVDITTATPTFVGLTNGVAANFPSIVTAAGSNSQSAIDLNNLKEDYLKLAAKFIFGSEEATGLFTNVSAINTGYNSAATANSTATNNILAANANTKVAASTKLVKQIAVSYIERFALQYKAVSVAINGTAGGETAAALYPSGESDVGDVIVVRGSSVVSSGITDATLKVKMSDVNGTVNAIFVTSNSTPFASNTGSGYQLGDQIVLKLVDTNNSNKICLIQIPSLNPVQVSILNGTLDNSVLLDLTKAGTIFNTDLNVGTGSGGVAALTGSFKSANGIAGVPTSGGANQNGSGATFDVVMNSGATAVSSIKINATGQNYVVDNLVTLTQGSATIVMTLSAAMANVLNGVDNAGFGTFPCPVSTDGKTENISITSTGSPSSVATVDVTMSDINTIERIALNTNGSGYASGDTITISAGSPKQKITATLTSNTATILNGNGATLIQGTNVPLEAGDKIQKVDGVSSASGQLNAQGEGVVFEQTASSVYLLS
jgi:hypothetical protein